MRCGSAIVADEASDLRHLQSRAHGRPRDRGHTDAVSSLRQGVRHGWPLGLIVAAAAAAPADVAWAIIVLCAAVIVARADRPPRVGARQPVSVLSPIHQCRRTP